MVRRLAPQVPQSITRLLLAQTIPPPVWYSAYLSHPPIPLPPRQVAPSDPLTTYRKPNNKIGSTAVHGQGLALSKRDSTRHSRRARTPKLRLRETIFEEDIIRRRFFADFPFEALRPVSLVENDGGEGLEEESRAEVDARRRRKEFVKGNEGWRELRQRSDKPDVEDVIAFTLHLSSPSNSRTPLPLSQSYALATTQYTRLRAIEEVAQLAREEERLVRMNERRLARVGGEAEGEEARFGEGEVEAAAVSEGRRAFDRFFILESRALSTNNPTLTTSSPSSSSSSRLRNSPSSSSPTSTNPNSPTRPTFGPTAASHRSWSPQVDAARTALGKARAEAATRAATFGPASGGGGLYGELGDELSGDMSYTAGLEYVRRWRYFEEKGRERQVSWFTPKGAKRSGSSEVKAETESGKGKGDGNGNGGSGVTAEAASEGEGKKQEGKGEGGFLQGLKDVVEEVKETVGVNVRS